MDYGKVLGFDGHGHLTHPSGLTEVHLRLGGDFGSSFLQIPHRQNVKSVVFKGYNAAYYRIMHHDRIPSHLFRHPCLRLLVPPS
jgi:hypothetical protein